MIIYSHAPKRAFAACGLRWGLGYLASGMSHAEILGDFPYLTEEDIRASQAFAADRERKLETLVA